MSGNHGGDQKRSLVLLVSSLSSQEYKAFSLPAAEHCLEHQTDKVSLVHCTKGNVKAQISNLVQTRNSRLARSLLCVSIVSEPRLSRSWRQRSEGFCPPDTLSNFFLIRSLASAMELISIKLSRVVYSIHPPLQSTLKAPDKNVIGSTSQVPQPTCFFPPKSVGDPV